LGINEIPKVVQEATERYWLENDIYKYFINDEIVKDEKSKLTLNDAYQKFKEWFKDAFPNTKIPDRKIFKKEMESDYRLFRLIDDKYWSGVKLRNQEDLEL
jgi:phage/plasmid-associated DNA primase